MNNKEVRPEMMYKAAMYLKNVTTQVANNQLGVVYRGSPLEVKFKWNEPTKKSNLVEIKNNDNYHLPYDYSLFLLEVSNGATLYYETQYGQSGFRLFSVEEIVEKQKEWKEYLGKRWQKNYLFFAEIVGELNVLLFDISYPTLDGISFAVYEANLLDEVKDWKMPSRSFHEWLDHLIQAQGDIYWHWY